MIKQGDYVLFSKCACGESQLTDGNKYLILMVKYPLFMFTDDNGDKRVRNINSKCFTHVSKKEANS